MNIASIAWVTDKKYGFGKESRPHGGLNGLNAVLVRSGLLKYPVKNYGRFDAVSKLTVCAAALAAAQAKIAYAPGAAHDIGLVAVSRKGCLDANAAYFKDYFSSGRKLARGNLFIYTLPTSPLAEAAIYLGFRGPLFYLEFCDQPVRSLLEHAAAALSDAGLPYMLAVVYDRDAAVCFVLRGTCAATKDQASDFALAKIEAAQSAGELASLLGADDENKIGLSPLAEA